MFYVILILMLATTAALFWPRRGVLARMKASRSLAKRALLEDFLKHIHAREIQGNLATTESLAGAFQLKRSAVVDTIARMESQGLISYLGNGMRLTDEGTQLAMRVVRAHRLLERYLFDELRMPLGALHAEADRREHGLSPEQIEELDARLGYPKLDPHGDPIPSGSGRIDAQNTVSLLDWADGVPAEIAHLEDEPPELFEQVLAAGLVPGMFVEVLERTEGQLILYDGTAQYVISALAATNVFVRSVPHPIAAPLRLSDLKRGESGRVRGLESRGFSRRRLLDLGITPGTLIKHEFDSPLGEPSAYRVREALIALRKEDASCVLIERAHTRLPVQST